MAIIEVGRVCRKTRGRNAGELCVISEKTDEKNAMVVSATSKKKMNIFHLEPTPHVIQVDEKTKPEDAQKMLSELG